jgi:hypothetical protein
MTLKRALRAAQKRMKRWLEEEDHAPEAEPPVPFDNSYAWIRATFLRLMRDPHFTRRPVTRKAGYVWGALQGVGLAKVLGLHRVSVIEFGVAGGAGLLALERIAEAVEELLEVEVEVYGFDTGSGLPKPQDYRDSPNLYMGGDYPLDKAQLEPRLRRARLKLGLVEETVPAFLASGFSPVAFVSIDLDLYSSTRDALRLFDANQEALLPRVYCYFDDINGYTHSDYTGERLAIAEFNEAHATRKLSPIYGLKHFVPPAYANAWWVDLLYLAHIFDHSLYGAPDESRGRKTIDAEGIQCQG